MDNELTFRYETSKHDIVNNLWICYWKISSPKGNCSKFLSKIREQVSRKIKLRDDAVIDLEQINFDDDTSLFDLEITGKGHDNRCSWCRYYRKYLKRTVEEAGIGFSQKSHCGFENDAHEIYDGGFNSRTPESYNKIPAIPLDRVDFPLERFRDEEAAEAYANEHGGYSYGKYSDGRGQGWMLFLPKDRKKE